MGINEIVIYIMVIFMVVGAIDKIFKNKLGLGDKFDEGIMAMGAWHLRWSVLLSWLLSWQMC